MEQQVQPQSSGPTTTAKKPLLLDSLLDRINNHPQ